MHLINIKIAGFKSFAEPVTISVPQTLCGIVGPNGSGKSNVIDAMRWVVGESSAKSLRGGTLDDVIFNGSGQRRPAGQASVELLFDNSLARCGGQWEKFAEISIRRTVTRDGISEYFINGTRARRRDVKELFLGTGFGPRSYSIIEQGMISRIVDGRPEDLSAFIEEASGVSRFREKRHETLLKLQQVETNLARLDDMRGEIDKRLRQLKYQAEQARRYRRQKERLRALRIQLLAYSWRQLERQVAAQQALKSELEMEFEKRKVSVRAVEADLEVAREHRLEMETQLTDVQMELFRINAEISDCDRRIEQHAEDLERTRNEIQARTARLEETEQLIIRQRDKVETAGAEHKRVQVMLAAATTEMEDHKAQLVREETRHSSIQNESERINQLLIEAVRRRELAFAALAQNQQGLAATVEALDSATAQIARLETESAGSVSDHSNQPIQRIERDCDRLRAEIEGLETSLVENRTLVDRHAVELDVLRDDVRETRVQLGALERSLGAALTEAEDEEFLNWLAENGLTDARELYESVVVSDGWERAVDRVLGEKLTALCVDDIRSIVRAAEGRRFSTPRFFINGSAENDSAGCDTGLARFVDSPNQRAERMLEGVYTADSLASAMAMQERLTGNECVVTADGSMVGSNWYAPAVSAEQSTGWLETSNLVRELRQKVVETDAVEEDKKRQIGELRGQVARQEQEMIEKRRQLATLIGDLEQIRAEQKESELQHLQTVTKLNELIDQERNLRDNRSRLEAGQTRLKQELATENDALAVVEQRRQTQLMRAEKQTLKLKDLQETLSGAIQNGYQLELEAQRFESDRKLAESSLSELLQRKSSIRSEKEAYENKLSTADDPTHALRDGLNELIAVRKATESRLSELRNRIEGAEKHRRRLDETRLQNQHGIEEINRALQEHNVEVGRLSAQCEEVRQKISEHGADAQSAAEGLGEPFDHEEITAKYEQLEKRIDGIGSVNLVAVEQYEQELERKSYLDEQYDDLMRAMETLQRTIRKIDKEARNRYNETYGSINSEFQRLLPKLFGGGSGHLELIGEYPDNIGLRIYARPKGKRIHNIQALSGGEKALTAVALILSMFQLNPSPVCLLDEIDAPLDDENVYRLCDSLHELADSTQMILITHNKITMEAVDTLIGVTMPEPNVSKVLSVDLLEAQEFVA